jgi:hypothetical protein
LGRDRAEDEPEPQRRGKKDGDRDSGMMRFALRFSRRLGTKAAHPINGEMRDGFREARAAVTQAAEADIFEAPGAYLSDPHDWASPFYSHDAAFAGEFDAVYVTEQDHYFPHL